MRRAATVAQVRAAEDAARAGLPDGALMERAVAGIAVTAARCLDRVVGARVTLLVGAGDNGADALRAGALLARRGAAVTAWLAAEPRPDALAVLLAEGGRVADPAAQGDAARAAAGGRLPDLVVDGLVGLGGRGGLRPAAAALAERVRGALTLSVDLPSGVDPDTGVVDGAAVQADVTVATGCWKPGHLLAAGRCGQLVLVELGLELPPAPVEALEAADVAGLLGERRSTDDKYSRGVVGVAAGSATYPGAAVLATGAALQAGAGMVRFAGDAAPHVLSRWPEAVVTTSVADAGRVQAWVVGPGLGAGREDVVGQVLAQDVPVLVDADALTLCAAHPEWLRRRTAPTLLTPHAGEFARFGGEVGPDRLAAARALAAELGVHVLLKGSPTVVTGPDGPARVDPEGTPVLATAGSGDVLSGAAGALLAQGLAPLDAGSAAAWLHGRAGSLSARGSGSTTAQRLLAAWPDAVAEARAGS